MEDICLDRFKCDFMNDELFTSSMIYSFSSYHRCLTFFFQTNAIGVILILKIIKNFLV